MGLTAAVVSWAVMAGWLLLGSSAAAWTPAQLASPAGWYKSSAGVVLSGSQVTQWTDQSSAGNDLTPLSSDERAEFVSPFVDSFYYLPVGPGAFHSRMRRTALTASLDRASISGGLVCWCPGSDSPLVGFGPSGSDFAIQVGTPNSTNNQYLQVYDGATTSYINTSVLHQSRKMWVSWRNNGTALEVWSNHGHFTGTKLSSKTLSALYLAALADDSTIPSPAQFVEIALSAAALDDTTQGQLNTYLAGVAAPGSPNSLVATVGDSITWASGPSDGRAFHRYITNRPNSEWRSYAIPGFTMQSPPISAATLAAMKAAGGFSEAIALVYLGTNDVTGGRTGAQIFADLDAYRATLQASGWKVAACLLQDIVGFSSICTDFNTLLSASASFDAKADFHTSPLDDGTNTTYFPKADGVHPSTVGASIQGSRADTAMMSI